MPFYQNPRQVFADALEKLLISRSFDSLTVNDLIDEAKCSRSTFYRYFKDKYDLVSWIYDDLVEQARNSCSVRSLYNFSVELLHLYASKPVFFRRMWSLSGQNTFPELFFSYTTDYEMKQVQYALNTDKIPKELEMTIRFYVAGVGQLIKDWALTGMTLLPEELAKICEGLCPQQLSYFLDQEAKK